MVDARTGLNLIGVHPDLVRVVLRAYVNTKQPFIVIDGVRTLQEELRNISAGASTTTHSRHLDGHAVDVVALTGGKVDWASALYADIAVAMQDAAGIEKVPIEWGGAWRTLKDFGHFQLPWASYPSIAPAAVTEALRA